MIAVDVVPLTRSLDEIARSLRLSFAPKWPLYPQQLVPRGDWPIFLFVVNGAKVVAGSGGFLAPPDKNGFVQIGYEVAPMYRGQGIATSAMQKIIDSKSSAKFVAATDRENRASVAVLAKLGFSTHHQVVGDNHGANFELWYKSRTAI